MSYSFGHYGFCMCENRCHCRLLLLCKHLQSNYMKIVRDYLFYL